MKTATLHHQRGFSFDAGISPQKSNLVSGMFYHYAIIVWAVAVVCVAIALLPAIAITGLIKITTKTIGLLLKTN